jgi:uncharacterized membrane protein YgcG
MRDCIVKRPAATAALALALALLALAAPAAAAAPPSGPPYPAAVNGQRVYDYAGIFSPRTIASAEATMDGIEDRTGAQVVVYTQVKPESDTLDKANQDALDLMNQWGVGRKGIDDGLVILFDMEPNLRHGQVSLYGGAGYRAAFLSDGDRQDIFDNDMKPLLVAGDLDGGLLAGLARVDANATPEHAATLERGRILGAALTLGAALLGLLLILLAFARWFVRGRDPSFLDDPSIYMPAPPEGLSPAMATLLLADRTNDRTVMAGLVDLAAGGSIAFREDKVEELTRAGLTYLREGKGLGEPESAMLERIGKYAAKHHNYVTPKNMYHLSSAYEDLKCQLEKAAVKRKWIVEAPASVTTRWYGIAGIEITLGAFVGFAWLFFPTAFVITLAVSLVLAGVVTCLIGYFMPSRTHQGAVLTAMLKAYQRTLAATLRQSRSMTEVVARKPLPWVNTPDEEMAWGIAFGLDKELEAVLARSLADSRTGAPGATGAAAFVSASPAPWTPSWWTSSATPGGGGHGSHAGGISPGLFSSSAFPDPGPMFAALGHVSSPPSPPSSGSSGGGGFGGGGGGGGGGAGGGF